MNYYISNQEIDDKIAEIRKKIRLSMNGEVSDQMITSGIVYKINYGVIIPRIREIAAEYVQNVDLAQRLWILQIRETMILATLLYPVEKFSIEHAQQWVESFQHIEIVEQVTMNLFCKLPFAPSLVFIFINSENVWVQITGFMLAARVVENFQKNEIEKIVLRGVQLSETVNYHLYKAIGLCLSRLCRTGKETASLITSKIVFFKRSALRSQQHILTEVEEEILFLNIL